MTTTTEQPVSSTETKPFDHLGWTEDCYGDVHGYYPGYGQRVGTRLHIMRALDSGPGAVSVGALCGGLQGACVVGIRREGDTHHTDAKIRFAPYQNAQEAVDSEPRRAPFICPRCLDRVPRAKTAVARNEAP